MFNPRTFLQTTIEGSTSTKQILVPEGAYTGIAQEVTERCFRLIDTKNGQQTVVDVNWQIDDAEVVKITHRPVNRVRQTIFLDLTPEGNIDNAEGLNNGIGRLREAVGQNNGSWNFAMLEGHAALVEVTHSQSGDRTYANVDSVTRIGAARDDVAF